MVGLVGSYTSGLVAPVHIGRCHEPRDCAMLPLSRLRTAANDQRMENLMTRRLSNCLNEKRLGGGPAGVLLYPLPNGLQKDIGVVSRVVEYSKMPLEAIALPTGSPVRPDAHVDRERGLPGHGKACAAPYERDYGSAGYDRTGKDKGTMIHGVIRDRRTADASEGEGQEAPEGGHGNQTR